VTKPVPKPEITYYTIRRVQDGWAVFNSKGVQLTPDNMWPITIAKLEQFLKKDAQSN